MNVYKFETLNEFGYAKDPHTVFKLVMDEVSNIHSYEVSVGCDNIPLRQFKNFDVWKASLSNDDEVYYELYGKRRSTDKYEMLGIVKIDRFRTID